MQLKFTATKFMREYHGPVGLLRDSEVRDVPGSEAARLLAAFPDNFSAVGDAPANTAEGDAPANLAQGDAPANTAEEGSKKKKK